MKRNLNRIGVRNPKALEEYERILKDDSINKFSDYNCAEDCCNDDNDYKIVCQKCGKCGRKFVDGLIANTELKEIGKEF